MVSNRAAWGVFVLLTLSIVSSAGRRLATSNWAGLFVDVTSHTTKKYLPETMGSGAALFDYDNDGRLDIFFVNGATLKDPTEKGAIPQKLNEKEWNRLYHQKSDGTFEDVTQRAGLQGAGYGMTTTVMKTFL
jgi:hypothetical protein